MTESEASTLTTVSREPGKGDREVTAIAAIIAALKLLKEDEVRNVLEYVLRRFAAGPLPVYAPSQTPSPVSQIASLANSGPGTIKDVRSLREEKAPRSANEMAALVAYYVSELAPASERKPEINKTDVERYFKTAGFKLTANAGQTLVNAKNAGYLDAGSDAGYYRLNPAGGPGSRPGFGRQPGDSLVLRRTRHRTDTTRNPAPRRPQNFSPKCSVI